MLKVLKKLILCSIIVVYLSAAQAALICTSAISSQSFQRELAAIPGQFIYVNTKMSSNLNREKSQINRLAKISKKANNGICKVIIASSAGYSPKYLKKAAIYKGITVRITDGNLKLLKDILIINKFLEGANIWPHKLRKAVSSDHKLLMTLKKLRKENKENGKNHRLKYQVSVNRFSNQNIIKYTALGVKFRFDAPVGSVSLVKETIATKTISLVADLWNRSVVETAAAEGVTIFMLGKQGSRFVEKIIRTSNGTVWVTNNQWSFGMLERFRSAGPIKIIINGDRGRTRILETIALENNLPRDPQAPRPRIEADSIALESKNISKDKFNLLSQVANNKLGHIVINGKGLTEDQIKDLFEANKKATQGKPKFTIVVDKVDYGFDFLKDMALSGAVIKFKARKVAMVKKFINLSKKEKINFTVDNKNYKDVDIFILGSKGAKFDIKYNYFPKNLGKYLLKHDRISSVSFGSDWKHNKSIIIELAQKKIPLVFTHHDLNYDFLHRLVQIYKTKISVVLSVNLKQSARYIQHLKKMGIKVIIKKGEVQHIKYVYDL